MRRAAEGAMMGTILGMPTFEEFNQEFAKDFPGLKLGSFNDYNHTGPTITLPACVGREDCERIMAEIQAVIDWVGLRGEQKALAFLLGWGIPPVKGILGQPELTQEQSDALADALATSEKRVTTLLRRAAQACAELEETNDL